MPSSLYRTIEPKLLAEWVEHIALHADWEDIWQSTPASRAKLPNPYGWGDRHIHRKLQRLAKAGELRRVAKGSYSVL